MMRVAGNSRFRSKTVSMPSLPGMKMSVTTISEGSLRWRCSPSRPSAAGTTSQPSSPQEGRVRPRVAAIGGGNDLEAFLLEVGLDQAPEVVVVLDDKHARAAGGHSAP